MPCCLAPMSCTYRISLRARPSRCRLSSNDHVDAVVGIVVHGVERQRMGVFLGLDRCQPRTEQTADFRRQHPFVTRHPAHRIADETLGLAETIIRRRIHIAYPAAQAARTMASASSRRTAMRLPPRVAQPRPSAVTSSEVRPILRCSKAGIVPSPCCRPSDLLARDHTPGPSQLRQRKGPAIIVSDNVFF